ncbi:hypothetical protein [Streptomyces kaniharaensis]|uniref:hypothetical protein n=1 Tax=Streptomyces kaniharaensis TaxID=212423 RepID=UPI001295D135|nr:hypothetical protein [Streptomyces kaniharaensis]
MNTLLVAGLSLLLLAVLFVGWLVWLVTTQPRLPRPTKPGFALRHPTSRKEK